MKITKLIGYGKYRVETGELLADGREWVSVCELHLAAKVLKTAKCAKGEIDICPPVTIKLGIHLDAIRNLCAGESYTVKAEGR